MAKWKGNRREIGEDFFETPEYAILPILKYIPQNTKIIWEPTNGNGAISDYLEDFETMKTDIYPRTDDTIEMDFLREDPEFDFDFIIFNPPFSQKTQFLKRAIQLGKPFMFICPVNILETETRSKLINDNKISIINLSNRVDYIGKEGRKVWFHSVWILSDGEGKIHYEKINKK